MTTPQTTSYGSIDDHNQSTPRPSNPSSLRNQEPTNDDALETYHFPFSASYTLENKGSVARDHMANERTFLAWLRTSLAFITIGIGVTQLLRIDGSKSQLKSEIETPITFKYAKTIGSMFIIIGIITLLIGVQRYFQVQYMLTKNNYPAARLGILGLIIMVFIITMFTFFMVVRA